MDPEKQWFMDKENENRYVMHKMKKELVNTKTQFQSVKVIDTCNLGKILVTDNKIQSAQTDEFLYHECLVHPAMVNHPAPKHVLILGGGEGATLREVLKHKCVEKVTMVDIDVELIELCKELMPEWSSGGFEDPRFSYRAMDANQFVEASSCSFDVVVMDLSDPLEGGPAELLYTTDFFGKVKKRMAPDGVFVTQAIEVYFDDSDLHSVIHASLKTVFDNVASYYEYVPSFGSNWGFAMASQNSLLKNDSVELIDKRLSERGVADLKFFDGEAYSRLTSLPKCLRTILSNQKHTSDRQNPISVFAGL